MRYNFNSFWHSIIFRLCHDSVAAIGVDNVQGKFQLTKEGFGEGSYLTIVYDGITDAQDEKSYVLPTLKPFCSFIYSDSSFDYDCESGLGDYTWPIEESLRYSDAQDNRYGYLPETAVPRLDTVAYDGSYDDSWVKDIHVFMQNNTITFANVVIEITDDPTQAICTVSEFKEIYNEEIPSLDEMWLSTLWEKAPAAENGFCKIAPLHSGDWDHRVVVTFIATRGDEYILGLDRDIVINKRASTSPSLDLDTPLLIHNPAGDSMSKGTLRQLLSQGTIQALPLTT